MKKIIVILYDYYPTPSANTFCTDELFEGLIEEGYKLYIVTTRSKLRYKKISKPKDNVILIRYFVIIDYINRFAQKTKFKIIRRILLKLVNLFSKNKIGGYTDYFSSKKITKRITTLIKKEQINSIISFSFPFSPHELASKIIDKTKDIKWIAYEFDPFSYNYTLDTEKINDRKRHELNIFYNANLIVSTMGIIEKNDKEHFRLEYKYKNKEFPLPNLKISKPMNNLTERNKITLVYTGAFYKGIRTPNRLFDLLNKYETEHLEVHIYGDYNHEIYKNIKIPKFVYIHNKINKERVKDIISQSDILINFGNIMDNQFPSKLFEYMGYGKPIVNFYYTLSDTEKKYIERYNNIISISNQSTDDRDYDRLIQFCVSNRNKILSYDEISQRMKEYLSKNVVTNIINTFKEYL